MKLQALIVIVCLLFGTVAAHAEPLSRDQVPEPLRPWTAWVLRSHEDQLCPTVQNSANDHRCLWPSRLSLTVDENSARFAQDFRVYRDTFVMLPGDPTRWPLDIRIDGKPAAAIPHNNLPAVYLNAGSHTVEGSFAWDQMPRILPVPAETGLVSLTVDGKQVDFPKREPNGQLWLRNAAVQAAPEGLDVEVERRVVDEIPLQLVTRIELNVAGKDREVTLGKALPDGFVPMALDSPLPARVESDGHLRIQVRPGTWMLELTARHEGPVSSLAMPVTDAAWAVQEAWAFEAHNELRQVAVEGVAAVDPNQTRLPPEWRQFPTFLMTPGRIMRLDEKRRGNTDPEPDRLSLERKLWLDFGGAGYAVQDGISGTMSKSWRLEMSPPQRLGRVAIAGNDQVITRGTQGQSGVEIRQGQLHLEADSRIDSKVARLPAVGWDHDFQSVSALLNLPPGWRLFSAAGVDDVSASWITDWTLLELFLVLITAMIIYRMWSPSWGGIALVTLALTYPEIGAPKGIWLTLLVGEALDRVLPKSRGRWVIQAFRLATAATFVVIAIPFMVDQVRTAIYPALEFERTIDLVMGATAPSAGMENSPASNVGMPQRDEEKEAESAPAAGPAVEGRSPMQLQSSSTGAGVGAAISGSNGALSAYGGVRTATANYRYATIDPNAVVTTGPGLPRWQWRSVRFSWRGPVQRGQQIRLWLLSPLVNFLLGFLRVGLIALLAFRAFVAMRATGDRLWSPPTGAVAAFLALIIFAPLLAQPAHADYPSDALLNELQRRLLENRDCSPTCASIPRMRLEVQPATLAARIEIDASADIAIPLPGSASGFNPARVSLDGKSGEAIARTPDGLLWLLVPAGKHEALIEGALPNVDAFDLSLPLKPHRLEAVAVGWTVEGIHENGIAEDNIRLVRQAHAGQPSETLQPGQLPPFVRVTRKLYLGLEWGVDTTVERLTASDTALTLHVPQLPGEAVTTPGLRTENGNVIVNLPPATPIAQWHSTLKISPSIELKSPDSVPWTEVWQLVAEPMWHTEPRGIPEVYQAAAPYPGRIREWRPWSGEVVTVSITRPQGISGPTLTIDSSRLELSPGLRVSDVNVTLDVRSSRGGQKSFVLPPRAELQSLTIDGAAQPIRQEQGSVTIPIAPGRQTIAISWREPHGISLRVSTPKFDLGAPSVNAVTIIRMPADRWTLFVAPALLGPAVLFWGLLIVFALIAFALGRSGATPLRTGHWFLLSLGLTQVPIWSAAVVVGWLLALGWRRRNGTSLDGSAFRWLQVALAILTIAALAILFSSIEAGLLGLPQMQISGNGSNAQNLQWFHDRAVNVLPRMWAVSVPLMVYRLAMLSWALWLASALLQWLSWGWGCFSEGGLWRSPGTRQTPMAPAKSD